MLKKIKLTKSEEILKKHNLKLIPTLSLNKLIPTISLNKIVKNATNNNR